MREAWKERALCTDLKVGLSKDLYGGGIQICYRIIPLVRFFRHRYVNWRCRVFRYHVFRILFQDRYHIFKILFQDRVAIFFLAGGASPSFFSSVNPLGHVNTAYKQSMLS